MNRNLLNNETHIFFWNGIYSNWHPATFTYKGNQFQNSEQAFMWEKAKFFNDDEIADEILNTPTPSKNKALGRQVKNFNAYEWADVSYDIMYDINRVKFNQNPLMKEKLISTYPKTLVEASPYDKIWGIGMLDVDAIKVDPSKWRGKNLLGKVVTELRSEFQNES